MNNISLDSIKANLTHSGRYFISHSKMIYFILTVGVLIASIISLNLVLYQPSDEEYRVKRQSEVQSTRFDTDTINKIKNLNASRQTTTEDAPAGTRTNPFGE